MALAERFTLLTQTFQRVFLDLQVKRSAAAASLHYLSYYCLADQGNLWRRLGRLETRSSTQNAEPQASRAARGM